MKKALSVLILLFAAVSVFALNAKVLDVVGKVEVQNAAGGWDAVTPGTMLDPGAVLSTGFKSEAVLSIDETTLTVKALTRLTVEKLYEQEGNKSSSFYLDAGALSADVKSADNKKVSFTVKTPAVTASVRGTAGDLTVNTLVGTSGTWLLRPPEPKVIVMDRGDAVIAAPADASVTVGGDLPVVGGTAPAANEGAAEGTSGAGEDTAGAGAGMDDFDWSIDNGDVTVQPGQQASFSVGQDIVTPMQTAAAAATSTGGTQTLSAQEAVSSSAAPTVSNPAAAVLAETAPAAAPAAKKGKIILSLKWPDFN